MEEEFTCSTMDEYKIIKTLGAGYHATYFFVLNQGQIGIGSTGSPGRY